MRERSLIQYLSLFWAAWVFAGEVGLLALFPTGGLPMPVFGLYLIFACGAVGCATLCAFHGIFGYPGEHGSRTLTEIPPEEGRDVV
jgi:hypothetical protein